MSYMSSLTTHYPSVHYSLLVALSSHTHTSAYWLSLPYQDEHGTHDAQTHGLSGVVIRASNRNKVEDMATKFPEKAKFTAGKKAWSVPTDIALPCAFQNELSEDDAKELKANGCWCCCEVSNMGCQPGAIHYFQKNGVLFAPGKAVNAGGVATSGLEMTQNAAHLSWSAKEVDEKLHWIMENIHEQCVKFGTQPDGTIDYVKGANIAGFMKVAQAMLEQGVI